jgi:hypothetical protein
MQLKGKTLCSGFASLMEEKFCLGFCDEICRQVYLSGKDTAQSAEGHLPWIQLTKICKDQPRPKL